MCIYVCAHICVPVHMCARVCMSVHCVHVCMCACECEVPGEPSIQLRMLPHPSPPEKCLFLRGQIQGVNQSNKDIHSVSLRIKPSACRDSFVFQMGQHGMWIPRTNTEKTGNTCHLATDPAVLTEPFGRSGLPFPVLQEPVPLLCSFEMNSPGNCALPAHPSSLCLPAPSFLLVWYKREWVPANAWCCWSSDSYRSLFMF